MRRASLAVLSGAALSILACTGEVSPDPTEDEPAVEEPTPKPDRGKRKRPGKGRKSPGGDGNVCSVSAYLLHEEGTVKVYGDPNHKAEVVGEIPANHEFVRVDVADENGGFLHVTSAEIVIPDKGKIDVLGWIDKRLVRIGFEPCSDGSGDQRNPTLFARPSLESDVVHVGAEDLQVKPLDCRGTFWRIDDGKGHTGWVAEGQWCDNAVTNCIKACPEMKDLPR